MPAPVRPPPGELLTQLVENSPMVAIRWRLEPGWPVDYVSENISRFGYTAAELMSGAVSLAEIIESDGYAWDDSLGPVARNDAHRRLEYRLKLRSGERRLVRFLIRTTRDEQGRTCCDGMMADAPESMEHEQWLRILEQAVETARNGIVIADATRPDTPVIFANRAAEQISGYTRKEFLGRNCRFLQRGDHDQPALAGVREALRRKQGCHAVLRNYRKDGTLFWNEIQISPVVNQDGLVTHFIGVQADITNRKNTEATLARREHQYRTLVTTLKEVVFQTDATGAWTYLNPSWTEITGYSLEETLGKPFLGYVHPDDRERNMRLFQPLIERTKEYCRHEVRYLTKTGGFRWIEVFARLTFDDRGLVTGTAGTLSDITARREAEDAMRRQIIAIEDAADGMAILNHRGEYLYLNGAHLILFGYTAQAELLGRSWRELYSPEAVAHIEQNVFPALQREGQWRGTMKARKRDGSYFDEELSLTLADDGGLVCVCRDITERLTAESRTRQSLQEKEVMLKEIHHRVKNNMQIVSSLLNLQLEHIQDEESRTHFIDSQNRIASMALVHEKLYQSADLGRIAFREYAADLAESIVGTQGARAAGISFQLDAEDLFLGIDTAIPCGLIINELVSNAYKHAFPAGTGGTIRLRLSRPSPGCLALEISDTGRGLPADFDLRRARSLGMQLVHTLVQQLRGSVVIESGPGTRFLLRLQEVAPKRTIP